MIVNNKTIKLVCNISVICFFVFCAQTQAEARVNNKKLTQNMLSCYQKLDAYDGEKTVATLHRSKNDIKDVFSFPNGPSATQFVIFVKDVKTNKLKSYLAKRAGKGENSIDGSGRIYHLKYDLKGLYCKRPYIKAGCSKSDPEIYLSLDCINGKRGGCDGVEKLATKSRPLIKKDTIFLGDSETYEEDTRRFTKGDIRIQSWHPIHNMFIAKGLLSKIDEIKNNESTFDDITFEGDAERKLRLAAAVEYCKNLNIDLNKAPKVSGSMTKLLCSIDPYKCMSSAKENKGANKNYKNARK